MFAFSSQEFVCAFGWLESAPRKRHPFSHPHHFSSPHNWITSHQSHWRNGVGTPVLNRPKILASAAEYTAGSLGNTTQNHFPAA
jgi:hypothetical protein